MNAKFWSLAAVLAMGTACLDDEKAEDEEEETSEPTSEPSAEEPAGEPSTEEPAAEPSYAYITQSYAGSATVVPDTSYEGMESLSLGVNDTAGTGNLSTEIVWNIVGAPADAPADCADCLFSFDLNLTYDAAASTDPNGEGADMSFSYAVGTSSYGENTLFYGSEGQWSPWLVDGNSQADLEGTEKANVVSFDGTNFTYSDGVVDFYYYY